MRFAVIVNGYAWLVEAESHAEAVSAAVSRLPEGRVEIQTYVLMALNEKRGKCTCYGHVSVHPPLGACFHCGEGAPGRCAKCKMPCGFCECGDEDAAASLGALFG